MTTQIKNHNLDEPLAVGGTAEIYAWKPGWVLKLYFKRFEPGIAEYEHRIASAICQSEIPAPEVGDIISVNGRQGILYRRFDGISMWEYIAEHPETLDNQARQLAMMHTKLHEKPLVVEIPSLRKSLAFKLRDAKPLPENLRKAALEALEVMPKGRSLCHGDFHPGNILLSESEPIIIDWIDATIGSPLADVARTSILALGAGALDNPRYQQFHLRRFHDVYLEHYFELRPGGHDEYKRWLPIVAAARLNEGVPGWDEWLLAQVNALI